MRRAWLLLLARRRSRSVVVPAASATVADEKALAAKFAPARPARRADRGVRAGRAVRADRRRRPLRRADCRAARPLEPDRPRQDRACRRATSPTASSTTSTSRVTRSTRAATTSSGRDGSRTAPRRPCTRTSRPILAAPGKLALQYWFFYPYNEFNNLHEGDWEMIQLVFEADDAAEALGDAPVSVGYSSHEGAERADWGDDKLEVVDGTHPVVYPAAGSHANKFTEALYLGSSAEAGVGLRRHARPSHRADAPSSPRSRAIPRLPVPPSPGSRSRVAGASSSRRSSTGRPGRT